MSDCSGGDPHEGLRRRLLLELGCELAEGAGNVGAKGRIRSLHASQRAARHRAVLDSLGAELAPLSEWFACGAEVNPDEIQPELVSVQASTSEAKVFRLATLLWSIPVSQGFGRRLRFLVRDRANGKIIGIAAIGDPVFNLRVRDQAIGWDAATRSQRLVNLMDAYVLGAVPPYNYLLGGKLVASMLFSREVQQAFHRRYGGTEGVISGQKKSARLAALTTTSALGRSSVYNRMRLDGRDLFRSIGYTTGYGHFHVSNELFADVREYLRAENHRYADGNRFGQGPNWRFRVLRAAISQLGLDRALLRHGVQREVFLGHVAKNAKEFLRGDAKRVLWGDLWSAAEVAERALARWVRPRASRNVTYRDWTRDKLLKSISE